MRVKSHPLLMVHPFSSKVHHDALGNAVSLHGFDLLKRPYGLQQKSHPLQIIIGADVKYASDRGTRTADFNLFTRQDKHITSFPFETPETAKGKYNFNSNHGFIYGKEVDYGTMDDDDAILWKEILRRGEISVGGAVFGLCHRVAVVGNETQMQNYKDRIYEGEEDGNQPFRGFGLLDLFAGHPTRDYDDFLDQDEKKAYKNFKVNIPTRLVYVDLKPHDENDSELDSDKKALLIGRGFAKEPKQGEPIEEQTFKNFLHVLSKPTKKDRGTLYDVVKHVSDAELLKVFEWYLPPRIAVPKGVQVVFSRNDREIKRYGKGERTFHLNIQH